jgi:hypothetical protein
MSIRKAESTRSIFLLNFFLTLSFLRVPTDPLFGVVELHDSSHHAAGQISPAGGTFEHHVVLQGNADVYELCACGDYWVGGRYVMPSLHCSLFA